METSEPITIIKADGTTAIGKFRMTASAPGQFWIEYDGRLKTNAHSYTEPTYSVTKDGITLQVISQRDYMMSIGRILLREMTESDIGTMDTHRCLRTS